MKLTSTDVTNLFAFIFGTENITVEPVSETLNEMFGYESAEDVESGCIYILDATATGAATIEGSCFLQSLPGGSTQTFGSIEFEDETIHNLFCHTLSGVGDVALSGYKVTVTI